MTSDDILLDVEDRMEKAILRLKSTLLGIRTGRANPGLVDSLRVNVYGAETPLKQIATVGCPEPTQILIRPYDMSHIKDIEKVIISSDLGYTPQNDGRVIRLNIPPLSMETRMKLVSRIGILLEETRVSLRNVRRDGNKIAEKAEKDKELSENERDSVKAEIQELIKKYEDEAKHLADAREKDVMES